MGHAFPQRHRGHAVVHRLQLADVVGAVVEARLEVGCRVPRKIANVIDMLGKPASYTGAAAAKARELARSAAGDNKAEEEQLFNKFMEWQRQQK